MRLALAATLASALVVSALAGADGSCLTDEDCYLNGECTSGRCVCDKPWTGAANCSLLAFKPAPSCFPQGGCGLYGGSDGKTTTWGGSVVRGPDNAFWMAAAAFTNDCTLGSWRTNSEVVIARSTVMTGPYSVVTTAVRPWAHNPEMIKVPGTGGSDDVYVVYSLGNGYPDGPEKDCRQGSRTSLRHESVRTRAPQPPVGFDPNSLNFTLHYATHPAGPWMPHNTSFTNKLPDGDMNNWNPAPMLLPDGRVQLMVHTDDQPWGGEAIAEAESWKGPYTFITGDVLPQGHIEEDPFMWKDKRGHYHILVHKMFDPAGKSPIPSPGWCGGHSFSSDGKVWSNVSRAYNTTVLLSNGTTVNFARRERPKLLFDTDGVTPIMLTNGVRPFVGHSWTLAVPLDA